MKAMTTSARRVWRRLAGETRAAEVAEAAAVLPLMFMVLLGIFWFGQAFSIYGTITRAAQEGARAGAAAPQCTTCATGTGAAQNASNAVQAALAAAKLDATKARYPVPVPTVNVCPGGSASCDGASGNICVQTGIQLSNTSSGGAGVCGISVSLQYPFQFWLPFTPLNKQQIWLTASARARLENQ